ncbi:hypothetical protein [Halobacteriaceae bacterium SHR40]|uniref:hypothetical protein n=1 Tax=Halovenus amylolytica TaxID=2500550 RepID=UPI000FE4138E
MTEEGNSNTDSDRSVKGRKPQHSASGAWSRADWEALESDPDFGDDFEYELTEWEQFETLDGTDQVMFLPSDESELKDAAFVVAEETDLLELSNHC